MSNDTWTNRLARPVVRSVIGSGVMALIITVRLSRLLRFDGRASTARSVPAATR